MKKIILFAGLFILSMILVACGGEDNDSSGDDNNNATVNAEAEGLYKNNCASCHGDDLEGDIGPSLETVGNDLSEDEIRDIIENGSENGEMPPGLLEGDEADEVAAWLAERK